MGTIKIAPSVLAGDLGDLRRAVEICERGKADQVHLDVIDGHFAPNITFGPGTVGALRKATDLKFDTHLMIDEPWLYLDRFLDSGSDLVSVHAEAVSAARFDEIEEKVRRREKQLGLAIKPASELPPWALSRVGKIATLVVMTVNPGFSGQVMDMSVMPKLERLSSLMTSNGSGAEIEVDGGVEPENAYEVVKRGANVLVAGAGVYAKPDPVAAVSVLRRSAEAAVKLA